MHAKTWFPSNEMQKSPNPRVSPMSTEFGCNRIHTTYDMIIGFYAFVFGVIVGIMENFTGWERTGKSSDFKRSILYMVLVLPCFTTMTTLIPSIFIYLACGINYFATFHKKEIFTNNPTLKLFYTDWRIFGKCLSPWHKHLQ